MKQAATIKILLIEDEDFDVRRIKNTIKPFSDRIKIIDIVSNGNKSIELLESNSKSYDVVIMDFQIAGGLRGESLIKRIKNIDSTLQIIVVTKMTINMTDFEFANSLLEAGAMWYCTKYPGDIEQYIYQPTDFILSIFNAYEKKKLELDKIKNKNRLKQNIQNTLSSKQLVGESEAITQLRKEIQDYAKTDANILILGESGTGKELVASHIHYSSHRKYENFVTVNCGSLPEHLIESELFGFIKGAFTGANNNKKGLFEIADNGTIFLDEITELPIEMQSSLLRVIQEGEIDKIGRTGRIKVDVRIIAATNKDIDIEIKNRTFREDLYYRLNVFTLNVPTLAARNEDILILFDHFFDIFGMKMNKSKPDFDDQAKDFLIKYDWRGNVRELENVSQRMLLMENKILDINDIKRALGIITKPGQGNKEIEDLWDPYNIQPWRTVESELQLKYFQFVRENTTSDAEAARMLGIAPPNYYRMCKKLGIK